MNWVSSDVATAILGVISGFIFFVDGWRRSPKDILSFQQTSRIAGLAWLVGGGALTGLFTYIAKEQQGRAMMVYVTFFGSTLITSLFIAAMVVAIYYVAKYHRRKSFWIALTDSIPFTFSFFANGLDATLERIRADEEQRAQIISRTLERIPLSLVQFVSDVNSYLTSDMGDGKKGRNHFKYFVATFSRTFAVAFFEEKEILQEYRVAYFERRDGQLIFVEGADVKGSEYEFSGQPLEIRGSLAGYALSQNRIMHYPEDAKLGYQERTGKSPYKRFVVVPVPFKANSAATDRIGVLCLDSLDPDAPFRGELQRRLLIYFGNVISSAYPIYL